MEAYIVAGYRSAVGKAPKGKFRTMRPDDLGVEVLVLNAEGPSRPGASGWKPTSAQSMDELSARMSAVLAAMEMEGILIDPELLRRLSKKMKDAKVVDPRQQPDKGRVYFGATVTIADEDDNHRTVTIVGNDETDVDAGRIGWGSPIARALRGVAPDAVVASIAEARDIESCLRDASGRSPGLDRLPAITPVISDVEGTTVHGPGSVARPRPKHARRCDIWTFLAIRSRIRGNAFVKASEPYLTASDLCAAAYVRVSPDWHGKNT